MLFVFVHEDRTSEAFRDWPTALSGACDLGFRINRDSDTAWVRLAQTEAASTSRAVEMSLGETDLLLHFDDEWRLLAAAISDASLHLPPSACVPGAMEHLVIRYAEADDVIQVLFLLDNPVRRLDGYKVALGDEEFAPAVVLAKEPGGQVAALVLEGASRIAHETLLSAAA